MRSRRGRSSWDSKFSSKFVECGSPTRFDTTAAVAEIKVDRAQTVANVQIFSGLTESEVAFLAQRAVPRRFSPGETVFSERESCAGLYVVESGSIRIFKSSASGREQVLSIEGPGSSVAELPVTTRSNLRMSQAECLKRFQATR